MRHYRSWVLLAAALVLGWTARASADASCIQQADYHDSKFACRGVEPSCGTACLAGRQVCQDGVEAILDTGQLPAGGTLADCATGTDGCKATLQADKQTCPGWPCQLSDQACNDCVDGKQVTAFICRDTCRDSWRADPTVISLAQNCKDVFKACVQACPKLP